MRMIITSILLILFHQLLTRVADVSSQSAANGCTQNSMPVEDQGSAYCGAKLFFGDSFCQRIIQQDVTNAIKNECMGMNPPRGPSDEYKGLTTKIDSLDKKFDDVFRRLTDLILSTSKPRCPDGYEYYQHDKFCYKFHQECISWPEAREVCQQESGDLISLNKNNFDFFRNVSRTEAVDCQHVWVGTTDISSEGEWNWLNGEKISSVFWGPDQPDNYDNNENCGDLISFFEYKLNDHFCSNKYHFICQIV